MWKSGGEGEGHLSRSLLADECLVQHGSLKTASEPAKNNNNNMALMRAL